MLSIQPCNTPSIAPALSGPRAAQTELLATIAAHKAVRREWNKIEDRLDEIQITLKKGDPQPSQLVYWAGEELREHDVVAFRDARLAKGYPEQIVEKEYGEVREQLRLRKRDIAAWDRRYGLTEPKRRAAALLKELNRLDRRLGQLAPTTIADAAALLAYAHQQWADGEPLFDWPLRAVNSVSKFLAGLAAAGDSETVRRAKVRA